jgi:2-methylisocitrate lyase-like PEP mutase family enzyme
MTRAADFRALLERRDGLLLPGCHDALSARQVEAAGFPAVYFSGFSASAVMGLPDLGIMGLESMAARTREIAAAVDLPLFVDADDGYGGVPEAADCVRRLEAAGAVGVHIDDQLLPRPAGAGKSLVSLEIVQEKVAAARSARMDRDFLVIARTDAMATDGPVEALRRAKALEEAGADALMVMYLTDAQQVRDFASSLRMPLVIVVTETARKSFSAEHLAGAGHAATIYTVSTLLAGLAAQANALAHLRQFGDTQALEPSMLHIDRVRALTALRGETPAAKQPRMSRDA